MSWPIALGKYMTALHVWTDKKAVQSMKLGGGGGLEDIKQLQTERQVVIIEQIICY